MSVKATGYGHLTILTSIREYAINDTVHSTPPRARNDYIIFLHALGLSHCRNRLIDSLQWVWFSIYSHILASLGPRDKGPLQSHNYYLFMTPCWKCKCYSQDKIPLLHNNCHTPYLASSKIPTKLNETPPTAKGLLHE
jgi:hypothetical protein